MNVTLNGRTQHFRTVTFDANTNSVCLIEQRLLPHEFKIIATKDYRKTTATTAAPQLDRYMAAFFTASPAQSFPPTLSGKNVRRQKCGRGMEIG